MWVKICCIGSEDEARLAVSAGADALGLVSAMPSGPGVIDEARIRDIAQALGQSVLTVLLTRQTRLERVIEQHRDCATGAVQLVDAFEGSYAELRRRLGSAVKVIQVVHVRDQRDVHVARRVAPRVDVVLLDSGCGEGRPQDGVRELGGTGRPHDWSLSSEIVANACCPVWLAGGLQPGNVSRAISVAAPAGVDVCSGVRVDGRLDEEKLRSFVAAAKRPPGT